MFCLFCRGQLTQVTPRFCDWHVNQEICCTCAAIFAVTSNQTLLQLHTATIPRPGFRPVAVNPLTAHIPDEIITDDTRVLERCALRLCPGRGDYTCADCGYCSTCTQFHTDYEPNRCCSCAVEHGHCEDCAVPRLLDDIYDHRCLSCYETLEEYEREESRESNYDYCAIYDEDLSSLIECCPTCSRTYGACLCVVYL